MHSELVREQEEERVTQELIVALYAALKVLGATKMTLLVEELLGDSEK